MASHREEMNGVDVSALSLQMNTYLCGAPNSCQFSSCEDLELTNVIPSRQGDYFEAQTSTRQSTACAISDDAATFLVKLRGQELLTMDESS